MPTYPDCSYVLAADTDEPTGASYIYCLAAEVRELKRAMVDVDDLAASFPVIEPFTACDPYWDNVVLAMHLDAEVNSALAVAVADGYATKAIPYLDISETTLETWDGYFSEYGEDAVLSYVGGNGISVEDTGVLSTKTLPFDTSLEYRFHCANTCWTDDLANIDLEFLNSSNAVVCAVRNTDSSHNYASDLFYGASLSSMTQTGQATGSFNNQVTIGYITFTDTAIVFTSTASAEGSNAFNQSFSFNCAASTITQVRISNVRAKSTYTSGAGCAAYVVFHKRKTFPDIKGHRVTAYGASTSTARSAFPGWASGLFDDTYALVPYSTDFNIGTQDFTIDGWIYSTSTGTSIDFFSLIDSSSDSWANRLNIGKNNSNQLKAGIYNSSGTLITLTGSALPGSQWVHFELSRSGGTYYLFQDGELIDSDTPALITHDNSGITIGAAYPTSGWWRGNIDDLRFLIGNARHTTDFEPPPAPFYEVACL